MLSHDFGRSCAWVLICGLSLVSACTPLRRDGTSAEIDGGPDAGDDSDAGHTGSGGRSSASGNGSGGDGGNGTGGASGNGTGGAGGNGTGGASGNGTGGSGMSSSVTAQGAVSSGGSHIQSPRYRVEVVVGAPQAQGELRSTHYSLSIGPR